MARYPEPRTRTAAEIADDASDLYSELCEWSTAGASVDRVVPMLLRIVGHLTAQIEDLAAVVERSQRH